MQNKIIGALALCLIFCGCSGEKNNSDAKGGAITSLVEKFSTGEDKEEQQINKAATDLFLKEISSFSARNNIDNSFVEIKGSRRNFTGNFDSEESKGDFVFSRYQNKVGDTLDIIATFMHDKEGRVNAGDNSVFIPFSSTHTDKMRWVPSDVIFKNGRLYIINKNNNEDYYASSYYNLEGVWKRFFTAESGLDSLKIKKDPDSIDEQMLELFRKSYQGGNLAHYEEFFYSSGNISTTEEIVIGKIRRAGRAKGLESCQNYANQAENLYKSIDRERKQLESAGPRYINAIGAKLENSWNIRQGRAEELIGHALSNGCDEIPFKSLESFLNERNKPKQETKANSFQENSTPIFEYLNNYAKKNEIDFSDEAVFFHDLNGDGKAEAILTYLQMGRSCNTTSHHFMILNKTGKTWEMDSDSIIFGQLKKISAIGNVLTINHLTLGDNDGACFPTQPSESIYIMEGGKLVCKKGPDCISF